MYILPIFEFVKSQSTKNTLAFIINIFTLKNPKIFCSTFKLLFFNIHLLFPKKWEKIIIGILLNFIIFDFNRCHKVSTWEIEESTNPKLQAPWLWTSKSYPSKWKYKEYPCHWLVITLLLLSIKRSYKNLQSFYISICGSFNSKIFFQIIYTSKYLSINI